MKKVFGIIYGNNAHFYEVEINNLEELISYLSQKLKYRVSDNVLCNYYDRKVHDYGHYQEDINNGRCKVLREKKLMIDKNTSSLSEDNFRLGVIDIDLEYSSQIARVISGVFNTKFKYIDLTNLIKLSNYFNKRPNNLSYDSKIDKKVGLRGLYYNLNEIRNKTVNEEIWLNQKERKLTEKDFSKIIEKLSEKIEFSYLGSLSDVDFDDLDYDYMYSFAERNSNIYGQPEFKPLLDKIGVIVDAKMLKKV